MQPSLFVLSSSRSWVAGWCLPGPVVPSRWWGRRSYRFCRSGEGLGKSWEDQANLWWLFRLNFWTFFWGFLARFFNIAWPILWEDFLSKSKWERVGLKGEEEVDKKNQGGSTTHLFLGWVQEFCFFRNVSLSHVAESHQQVTVELLKVFRKRIHTASGERN